MASDSRIEKRRGRRKGQRLRAMRAAQADRLCYSSLRSPRQNRTVLPRRVRMQLAGAAASFVASKCIVLRYIYERAEIVEWADSEFGGVSVSVAAVFGF